MTQLNANLEIRLVQCTVDLNVHEIGIILSALQRLTIADETIISKDYGSSSSLYNRLHAIYDQMDKSTIGLRYEVTPSF